MPRRSAKTAETKPVPHSVAPDANESDTVDVEVSDLDADVDTAAVDANNSSIRGVGERDADVSDASAKLGSVGADGENVGDVGMGAVGDESASVSSLAPRSLWDSMGLSMAMGVPDLAPRDHIPVSSSVASMGLGVPDLTPNDQTPVHSSAARMQMQSSPLDQYLMVRISHPLT